MVGTDVPSIGRLIPSITVWRGVPLQSYPLATYAVRVTRPPSVQGAVGRCVRGRRSPREADQVAVRLFFTVPSSCTDGDRSCCRSAAQDEESRTAAVCHLSPTDTDR